VESEEEETAPRPHPTGNLFFYRPQNEAGTPLKQVQLASEPLSTPISPSMVCSGGCGLEEEEEEEEEHGSYCHNKEETISNSKAPLFNNAFQYPIFPTQNNNNRPAIKKDTAALDLILQKAAAFLPPLPSPQEKGKFEVEDVVVVVEEQEQITPRAMPIVPRCLAFDEEESIINNLEQEEGQQQRQEEEHCGDNVLLIPPAVESIKPVVPPAAGNTLHRLKQNTLERQSSQVPALSKLKQLTVQKQKHRIAAMRPQSALVSIHEGDTRNTHTTSINCTNDTYNDNACSKSNSVHFDAKKVLKTAMLPLSAAPAAVTFPPSSVNIIGNRHRTAAPAATEDPLMTSKKPYLKRRSAAIPMQHQGIPDWSAVKSRTQSRLDSNSTIGIKNSRRNCKTSIGASVAARQGQHVPRRYIDNQGVGIETMDQYRASYHNNQLSDNHGVRNRPSVPPLSKTLKRSPLRSNRPSTAPRSSSAIPSADSLGQRKPLSAAQRAAIRSRPFDATSIAVKTAATPADRPVFGPLGAAVIASGAVSNHQQHRHGHRDYSDSDQSHHSAPRDQIGRYEDPLLPLVSQVDQLLNSVGRAIRR